jgi:hypothetical protein
MKYRGLVIAIVWLQPLLTACAFAQAPFAEESPVKADLREAIFRYMFKTYNYGEYVKVYCIQSERILPEQFLQRFSGEKIPVVWATDCDYAGATNSVQEKKTKKFGMRMTIVSLRFIRGDEAEAQVEAYSDGIAANSNTLRLVRGESKWVVKVDKLTGVS